MDQDGMGHLRWPLAVPENLFFVHMGTQTNQRIFESPKTTWDDNDQASRSVHTGDLDDIETLHLSSAVLQRKDAIHTYPTPKASD